MKYSIREFAELLGVTVDTLRLYEKYGIINPAKDKRNGYRCFDDFDARDMLMSRWYRSLEFSMQEAAYLTSRAEPEDIISKVQRKRAELDEEIKRKMLLLEKLTDITTEYSELDKRVKECRLRNLPGVYRISQTEKNSLVKDASLAVIVEEWMKFLPFVFFSFQIPKGEIISGNRHFNYNWGLAVYEEEAKELKLKNLERMEYLPPVSCISSLIVSSSDYITSDSISFMFDYVKEAGYEIKGDIFGKIVLSENSVAERNTYLEVNIPV